MENLLNKQKELQEKQYHLLTQMQAKGFNLVSCCKCDGIIIVNSEPDKPIDCPHCINEVFPQDCEDYYTIDYWES